MVRLQNSLQPYLSLTNGIMEKVQTRVTADMMPRISQNLRLICSQCGKGAVYDVGRIFFGPAGDEKTAKRKFGFSNYFRCQECDGPGPWEVADYMTVLSIAFRSRMDKGQDKIVEGVCHLFDGTEIQTPALGEQYLLRLVEKDPRNGFLCARLGNLLRACGRQAAAIAWYEKALELDPEDIESRYHLLGFAFEDGRSSDAARHAPLLVRSLLDGRKTPNEELTEGLAASIVEQLRDSPADFQRRFLDAPPELACPREEVFIRRLLLERGDEEEIILDAADDLLNGIVSPDPVLEFDIAADPNEPKRNLIASLRAVVESGGLNPKKLTVVFETDGQGRVRVANKHSVNLYDGYKMALWEVPLLRDLFRGDAEPPPDLNRYPPPFCIYFYLIEKHVLTLCDARGDQTDQQMEEIYSSLRRRPDGRSLGEVHDFLWQIAALLLALYPLSEAEFDGTFGQLARSARGWALRPVSRNYVDYLRKTLGA
jgi:tetratricopeptide (TPR) repeat protein